MIKKKKKKKNHTIFPKQILMCYDIQKLKKLSG